MQRALHRNESIIWEIRVYYGNAGWWVDIEFSGLDPRSTYTFVGTANRSRSYPTRVSLFTILDAAGHREKDCSKTG